MSQNKITQSIFGAAYLESISAPSSYHLRFQVRPNLGEKIRHHLDFAESHLQTNFFPAFSLPKDASVLHPTPSDDLEWLMFSAQAALSGDIRKRWQELIPNLESIRARTGTKIALSNAKSGNLTAAGYDNPQYFDDIAMIRAVGIALVHRNNQDLMRQSVRADAGFTHAQDGLWAAEAIADLTWKLFNSADKRTAITETVAQLPANTWLSATVSRALTSCALAKSGFERILILEREVIDQVPSHPNSAPETLACLLAHALYAQSVSEFLMAAFAHPRLADSLPALHGALASLLFDEAWLPAEIVPQIAPLTGCCLPNLAGASLSQLVQQIWAAA